MAKDEVPAPTHLQWVIEGRAKNQIAALDIYEMMTTQSAKIRRLQMAGEAQSLAAIAFSLWRAVFLADRSGAVRAKMAHAEEFLAKMLTDNAIAFTQDRNAREWTFNYYIDNAWYRLNDLGQTNLDPPSGQRTPRRRWTYLQKALERAVRDFDKRLNPNARKT